MGDLNVKAALGIFGVFLGCMINVIFLEFLVKEDPGIGNLVNFSQFIVISIEGFILTLRFGTKKPTIPIKKYATLVTFFFLVSTANNWAFNFNIHMTLHLIFRSGSLMANMVLGMIIMRKRYTVTKYAAVALISLGITIATIASGKAISDESSKIEQVTGEFSDYFWWLVGISILTFALFMSARMGLYQEVLYEKYGKHPREALFFTHCLPLPTFLFLIPDLMTHITLANNSSPISFMGLTLPSVWMYMLGNVTSQCICINSVFLLTTECTSLTTTLVVTLRKFFSLVFSIFYFGNSFTLTHWLGTAAVFVGTFLYSELPIFSASAPLQEKRKRKKLEKKSN